MRFTLFMCVAHRIAVLLGQQEGIHMTSLLGSDIDTVDFRTRYLYK